MEAIETKGSQSLKESAFMMVKDRFVNLPEPIKADGKPVREREHLGWPMGCSS